MKKKAKFILMGFYHLNTRVISKDKNNEGKMSAVKAAAYRACADFADKHLQTHKYSNKSGFVKSFMIQGNETLTISDLERNAFWLSVDAQENRKDAQLFREVILSLHHDLPIEENEKILKQFIIENFTSQGMIADVHLHNPKGENLHAHIMLTMRKLESVEKRFGNELNYYKFGKKERDWNDLNLVNEWRKSWEILSNQALEKHDCATVSCESYETQKEIALRTGDVELYKALEQVKKTTYVNAKDFKAARKKLQQGVITFVEHYRTLQRKSREKLIKLQQERMDEQIKLRLTQFNKRVSDLLSRSRTNIKNAINQSFRNNQGQQNLELSDNLLKSGTNGETGKASTAQQGNAENSTEHSKNYQKPNFDELLKEVGMELQRSVKNALKPT